MGIFAMPVTCKRYVSGRKIGENAFYGCDAFAEIVFSEGLTEIGELAFYLSHRCGVQREIYRKHTAGLPDNGAS